MHTMLTLPIPFGITMQCPSEQTNTSTDSLTSLAISEAKEFQTTNA